MITVDHPREELIEGRSYGFGFAFLRKLNKGEFATLSPFSACKDYLNDFVYIEVTGKPLRKVYGFKHNYLGNVFTENRFYFGVRPLHYLNKKTYAKYDEIKTALLNNTNNIIKALNILEDYLSVGEYTKLEHLEEDGTLVLSVPKYWSQFGFLISLYTLYIRLVANIEKDKLKGDFIYIIDNHKKTIISEDAYMIESISKLKSPEVVKQLLDYKYPEIVSDPIDLHNFGISARLSRINAKAS